LDADLFLIVTTVRTLYERLIADKVTRELTANIQTLQVTWPFKGEEDAPECGTRGETG
jgi:hypothetical protein